MKIFDSTEYIENPKVGNLELNEDQVSSKQYRPGWNGALSTIKQTILDIKGKL